MYVVTYEIVERIEIFIARSLPGRERKKGVIIGSPPPYGIKVLLIQIRGGSCTYTLQYNTRLMIVAGHVCSGVCVCIGISVLSLSPPSSVSVLGLASQ